MTSFRGLHFLLLFLPFHEAMQSVLRGTLQPVIIDNFELDQNVKFCALLSPDSALGMNMLTNILGRHCHVGAEVELDLLQEIPSGLVADESPALPQFTVVNVRSVNGVSISSASSATIRSSHDTETVSQQLDRMVRTVKEMGSASNHGRRLATPVGIKSVLLVRITLTDDSADTWSNATYTYNTVWGVDYSASVSFKQSSYGILELDTSKKAVRNVILSTSVSTYSGCAFEKLGSDALAKLTTEAYPHSTFDLVQFIMPRLIDCNFGGVAYVGGGYSWVRQLGGQTVTHELGHNFGVVHAATDENNDNIQDNEYGDYSSVMGGPTSRYTDVRTFNAVHRAIYGWLTQAVYADFGCPSGHCSQTFNLHDLQTTTTAVVGSGGYSIIGSPKDSDRYYYFSYRAGVGLDAANEPQYQDAVFVHYLSDTSDNSFLVIYLHVGETYPARVNTNGVLLITMVSSSNGIAVLRLEYNADVPCVDVDVALTDSFGDGWNKNYLRFSSASYDMIAVTAPSGSSYSASVCLPPGLYTPYCCGGEFPEEVSWSLSGDPIDGSITGGAMASCSAARSAATNQFEIAGPTNAPTFAPTTKPSLFPTSFPSVSPTIAPSNPPSATPTTAPTASPSSPPSATPTSVPSAGVCHAGTKMRISTVKHSSGGEVLHRRRRS